MLFEKKAPVLPLIPSRNLKKELHALYARRSALDNLIERLEDYSRFKHGIAARTVKRRTA
jgi:hypothetical protein